jgi:uncharacterized protein involved in outer membrane biogenesis
MRKNVKVIIVLILLSFLAIIGAGLKYISTLDQGELKSSFTKALKNHSDLDISLNGDVKISYFPVAIELNDVTILNPKEFKTENLLSLKNVQARFQILPLLFKKIVIDKLALKEGYITLEIDNEGKVNWPLTKVEAETETKNNSFQLTLENVSFENIALQYLDSMRNLTKKVSISSAKMSTTSIMESNITVNGRFEETPLSINYTGPTPQYLFTNKKNMANVGFKTRFSGTTLEIMGKIGPMIPETFLPVLDINAILIGGKLSALNPLLDTDFPDIGPYEVSFEATADETKLDLKNVISKLKQNEVTGNISFNLKDNYSYQANLNVGALNTQDFKNLNGNTEDTKIELGFLQVVQGKGSLVIKSISDGDTSIENISANIDHTKNTLKLSDVKAKLYDGDLSGSIEIALNDAQNISTEFNLKNAPLEKIFDNGISNSPTSVEGFLHSYGKTLPALTQNLSGDLVVKAGPGKMAKNKLALFERDLLFVFFPQEKDPSVNEVNLNCLVADIEIYKGLAGTSFFMLDTEHLTLGGLGTLDLNNEKIQFLLDPRPKSPKFISASTPLHIRGTLDNFSVTPTAGSILEKGIGIALTGLAGPLGIFVPLLTTSTTGAIDKNPCELALKGQYKQLDLFKDQQKGKTSGKINDVKNLFKMLDKEHETHSKN